MKNQKRSKLKLTKMFPLKKKSYKPKRLATKNFKKSKILKTRYIWAEYKKKLAYQKIQKRNELHRQQIIDEIKRIRNTPKENGKYPTYREIEMMTGVSRQEIGDILNGKANARYLSKRIKI